MGFQESDVLPEEWEVVEAVAKLIQKNPHWLANFGANRAEDQRIRSWDLRSAVFLKKYLVKLHKPRRADLFLVILALEYLSIFQRSFCKKRGRKDCGDNRPHEKYF